MSTQKGKKPQLPPNFDWHESLYLRTSSKTAAAKFGSPQKKRPNPGSGGQIPLPEMPQHDPYTPSKRQVGCNQCWESALGS